MWILLYLVCSHHYLFAIASIRRQRKMSNLWHFFAVKIINSGYIFATEKGPNVGQTISRKRVMHTIYRYSLIYLLEYKAHCCNYITGLKQRIK